MEAIFLALALLLFLPAIAFVPGGPLRGRGNREPDLTGLEMSRHGFLVDKKQK